MANSPEFVAHAVDLLGGIGPVQARAMFGGHGVYAQGVMFGLLDDDELFLKTDEVCRPRFEAAGCRRWVYPSRSGPMETGYFRPPDEAHEDAEAMLPWARLALDCALRKAAAKAAPKAGAKATARAAKPRAAKPASKPARAAKKAPPKARPTPRRAPRRRAR
jgi:DNA transformation protein